MDSRFNTAIQRFVDTQGSALLPYPTADKIIAEVMKNGHDSREAVMQMLLTYLTESLQVREAGLRELSDALKSMNDGAAG